jgi:hypothetical protein
MCDITTVFTAIRKVVEGVDVYTRESIPIHIMHELGLEGRDEYLAMRACGYFTHWEGLDYDEAYKVLGKDRVDEWLEEGTFTDRHDSIAYEDLGHWCDPAARQKYYEEYLAKNTKLRRTDSVCTTKIHRNFTIAEIEHAVREKKK